MPKVNNEDYRDKAFTAILKATEALNAASRGAIQQAIVERAFAVLSKYGRAQLCQSLADLPLDAAAAEQALELYLQMEYSTLEPATLSPGDSLLGLIVGNLRFPSRPANTLVIQAFCRQLDRHDNTASAFNRDNVARTACECDNGDLRRRLEAILLRSYEQQGLANLRKWELFSLAQMPSDWWIERLTQISLGRVDRDDLSQWVERCVWGTSDAAIPAVIIATEWISRAEKPELAELWFDIATSAAPVPPAVRRALAAEVRSF
jgi:hypothetical protein